MENPANKKMGGPFRPDILKKLETDPPGLSRFVVAMVQRLSKEEIEDFVDPEMDWYYDAMYGELSLQFRSWLYGEQMARQEVSYPAGWWQAFKFRWFPGFLKSVWPVEYETVIMDAKILYPELRHKLSLPKEPHVMHIGKEKHSD
jgi:hypothetical protein